MTPTPATVTLGPLWHTTGPVRARGWGATPDGRVHVGAALAEHLALPPDGGAPDRATPDGAVAAFASRAAALGGDWAAVWSDGDATVLAVDRARSIPLCYARTGTGAWLAGDDARALARAVGARADDPLAAAALMLAGVVTGSDTLAPGVQQVQAGERVRLTPGGVQAERVFRFGAGPVAAGDDEELVRRGAAVFEEAFESVLASVRGRQLVLPLSGGMDSRLVAAMLVRGGRTDAVCYSYGEPWRFEPRASRAVARLLGLPWHFVRYSSRRWSRWSRTPEYAAFRRSAPGLATVEHEQDWPAVYELRRRGVIPDGAVLMPGHSGDFLSGRHLPTDVHLDSASGGIWESYYREWPVRAMPPDVVQALHERIARVTAGAATPAEASTQWDWQERQTKTIVNSVRSYEGFGLDWRLPLWSSRAALDFWGTIPVEQRRGRRLYLRVLRRLMGDALFDLPATPRRGPNVINKLERLTDSGLDRYGIWLGPAPLASRLRVRDLVHVRDPGVARVVADIVAPLAGRSAVRVPINGLLALAQLNDLADGRPLS